MVTVQKATVKELNKRPAYDLLAESVYQATTVKVKQLMNALEIHNGQIFIALENSRKIGIIAAILNGQGNFEIKTLYVRQEFRRIGVGRLLVTKFISENENPIIIAETDDDAVRFYHSLGFRIQYLGEKYPGTVRYSCIYDHLCWNTHPYDEIIRIIQKANIQCWVSGGIAIDLHIGNQTRQHLDTDISILRRDQLKLREILSDWEIYHTHAPGLRYWRDARYLETIPNFWVRRNEESPWAFEVMFQDSERDSWVYRRNKVIQRKIEDIGLENSDGIPYLRPEIQLLYKAGGSSYKEKDVDDLMSVLPVLSKDEKEWLVASIKTEFPNGHDWIDILESKDYI